MSFSIKTFGKIFSVQLELCTTDKKEVIVSVSIFHSMEWWEVKKRRKKKEL